MAKKNQTNDSLISTVNLPLKRALQEFQTRQLERNFNDLYKLPEYGKFCQFFVEDIYGAKDFEARNRSFEQITKYFKTALGEHFFHGLVRLLDLYALSDRLDDEMVVQLAGMGISDVTISQSAYDEAYYLCDNYDDRILQLDMVIESLVFAHALSHHFFIGWLLKTARATAHLFVSSKESIVETLQRGYTALHEVKSIEGFNKIVYERELNRLNRIYEFFSKKKKVIC